MSSDIVVLNMKGQEVSKRKLNENIFSLTPRKDILHFVVVNHLANCRQGTQSTLTRSQVRGGGRKPWRQKGTGRARQGSTRSPQWVHGGVALGPKPRKYGFSINKKVRRLAIKHALSLKFMNSELVLVDSISMSEYKTKAFLEFMNAIKVSGKSLVVLGGVNNFVVRSASNLKFVKTSFVGEINVYDLLNCEKLILEESSLNRIEEVYA